MGKKKKQPFVQKSPNPSKKPTAVAIIDWEKFHPAWSVKNLEMVHPDFGWQKIDEQKLNEIREKLGNFESMTWHEILVKSKKQNHSVSIPELSNMAIKHLQDMHQIDIDHLISLHLSGKERIWGIKDRNILILLWWDPGHLVYPSYKKHT